MRLLLIVVTLGWLTGLTTTVALGQESPPSDAPAAAPSDAEAAGSAADESPAAESTAAEPSSPSEPSAEPAVNHCATCHTEPALWDDAHQQLYIAPELAERDIHMQKGVLCSNCHGGDPANMNFAEAHVGMFPVAQMKQRCAECHKEQRLELIKSVHAKAGAKDDRGRGLPMDCGKCHGENPHGMVAVTDERSPVYLNNQVQTCGACHEEDEQTYNETVHGRGLNESGLTVVAVCASCHGAHGIYYAADRRSTLNVANVAATCSKCHMFIEERLAKSVHGRGQGLGHASDQPAAGGKIKRYPTCTDCHQGHYLLRSDMAKFRLELTNRCGNCHTEVSSNYAMSMHGELTHRGLAAAAECADCHGAHDILPIDDPHSRIAVGENRLRTCQKCHVYAVANFASYEPHANFKDEAGYPGLHAIYGWIQFTVNLLFILFLLHAFLWFVRALVDRLQEGGHTPLGDDKYVLPRFESLDRATFSMLTASFVGLTASGVAIKYNDQEWGQRLARMLGGFESVRVWHHFFAVMAILAAVIHLSRATTRISQLRQTQSWKSILFGPDSLVPNGRDFRDLGKMLLWFVGFGPKPGFERWAYWEKFDYWALCFTSLLIGGSGLMLWYPNVFCLVLPGTALNVAKMIHSEFAIYIASFLFLIHFFHAHFRPEKFPMDLSVMTGLVSEQHLRKYRPDYIARLEREGRLEAMRQPAPTTGNVWFNVGSGVLVITLGLCLLAVTVLASLGE